MNDLTRPFSLDTYLADLAPLINLDCGTRTPAGVARVADIMTEKYEAIGWQVTRHQFAAECGPCLEATNAPGADHYDVMLVGHMDTVFPEGTAAKRPLKIEGNQAFGPGVSDMKSGLLSTWYALKEMDPAQLAKLKVLVCCNCDEEIGSPWSKDWLVEKARQSGCVLVAEAARNQALLLARAPMSLLMLAGYAAIAPRLPQSGARLLEAHQHVLESLSQHDAESAVAWTRKHLADHRRGFEFAGLDMDAPIPALA